MSVYRRERVNCFILMTSVIYVMLILLCLCIFSILQCIAWIINLVFFKRFMVQTVLEEVNFIKAPNSEPPS